MDYFGHNERTGRKPKPGTPDVVRADFEPAGFTISRGIVVQESCGCEYCRAGGQCAAAAAHEMERGE